MEITTNILTAHLDIKEAKYLFIMLFAFLIIWALTGLFDANRKK